MDTGDTANAAYPKRYPPRAKLKSGNRRRGKIRFAADAPTETAGLRDMSAAFLVGGGTPAILRTGASGSLEGKLDSSHYCLRRRKLDAQEPLSSNAAGHYVSHVLF